MLRPVHWHKAVPPGPRDVAFNADSLGLQATAVALLRDLVHERNGLYYDDSRLDLLIDRLAPLVTARGFSSFIDYFYLLKYDEAARDEWHRVMDALSVPETYFWREIDQLKAIVDVVIPERVAAAPNRPITIWSAPCASGEEPLTLAMLLEEHRWFDRVDIRIHAGDASPAIVQRARTGLYRERSFRTLPPDLRDKYFTCENGAWRVQPALHRRVRGWHVVNLLAAEDAHLIAASDVIFCRNAFIYFSEDAVRRVVRVFAHEMPVPGYLCVGASESLLRITRELELEEIRGAFVYVKRRRLPSPTP